MAPIELDVDAELLRLLVFGGMDPDASIHAHVAQGEALMADKVVPHVGDPVSLELAWRHAVAGAARQTPFSTVAE